MTAHSSYETPDVGAGTEVEIVGAASLQAMVAAETDVQISTAKRYPRNIQKAESQMTRECLMSHESAQSMGYSLPRRDKHGRVKPITGATVRFAEVVARSWGNIRCGFQPVGTDGKVCTVRAIAHDLETNCLIQVNTTRRIVDKDGRRYSDDMIINSINAAGSIALRNAILKVVPKTYWGPVYDAAMKFAGSSERPLGDRQVLAVEYFDLHYSVSKARVLACVGQTSVKALTEEDIATLRGLVSALQEGATTVEEAFPENEDNEDAPAGTDKPKKRSAMGHLAKGRRRGRPKMKIPSDEPEEPEPPAPAPEPQAVQTEPPQGNPKPLSTPRPGELPFE